jgi:hypothetical protein
LFLAHPAHHVAVFELRRELNPLPPAISPPACQETFAIVATKIGQLGRDFDRMAERLQSLVDGPTKRLLGDVSARTAFALVAVYLSRWE